MAPLSLSRFLSETQDELLAKVQGAAANPRENPQMITPDSFGYPNYFLVRATTLKYDNA